MSDVTLLSIVLLVFALLLWAWRERGRTIEKARLAEAEGRRARQIDSAAADAADLLTAVLTSLRLARETAAVDPDGWRTWVADAERAARTIAALLESARVHARDGDTSRVVDAGGYVRLAIAIARAEGHGVALKGDGTALTCRGAPKDAIAVLAELIEMLSDKGGDRGFVTVELAQDAVTLSAPCERTLDLVALGAEASRVGWSLSGTNLDGINAVAIRGLSPQAAERETLDEHAVARARSG